jgi:hypothetical protein
VGDQRVEPFADGTRLVEVSAPQKVQRFGSDFGQHLWVNMEKLLKTLARRSNKQQLYTVGLRRIITQHILSHALRALPSTGFLRSLQVTSRLQNAFLAGI